MWFFEKFPDGLFAMTVFWINLAGHPMPRLRLELRSDEHLPELAPLLVAAEQLQPVFTKENHQNPERPCLLESQRVEFWQAALVFFVPA